ncbi:YHYH protein [Hydrogenophaga sp. PAMC20947]|uniref:YHYH protein n=1 Tax=Hydrogenophaga sp. PAMC20947 TaxID=2565558 RepID=UPI00109DD358|nr:YHYH protein [Hydrogenophaga sp. PAMC20947]QCB46848.1 YHYH protein [Hydrogenophaga sp. PAMC20947]
MKISAPSNQAPRTWRQQAALLAVVAPALAASLVACGGGSDSTTTAGASYDTAGVQCGYSYSGYNSSASVQKTSTASWTCSSTTRTLAANGIPDHTVGTFPNSDNPNTISAQSVSASYTLTPVVSSASTTLGGPRGATGYILNGIKIDAGTNGTCDDSGSNCDLGNGGTGQWRVEALGQSSFKFGTDSNNAHVQPDGAYHYHGMPEGFVSLQGKGSAMTLVGWAADGFPIYARYGYSDPEDATSAIRVMQGSYALKSTPDTSRPSTALYPMGAFTQDYAYVEGQGDLDECNGRTGVTPEFPQGTYHYFATDSYPFLQRCVKGSV